MRGLFGIFVQYSKHTNHNSNVQDVCIKHFVEQAYWQGFNLFDQNVYLSVADWRQFQTMLGGLGVHHSVTFGSAKVCSPTIFETCFSFDKDTWIAASDYYMYVYIIVLFSIDIYSPVYKFYSVIIFSLLINAVILLLNHLILILYLYKHFLSLRHYFIYLNII